MILQVNYDTVKRQQKGKRKAREISKLAGTCSVSASTRAKAASPPVATMTEKTWSATLAATSGRSCPKTTTRIYTQHILISYGGLALGQRFPYIHVEIHCYDA